MCSFFFRCTAALRPPATASSSASQFSWPGQTRPVCSSVHFSAISPYSIPVLIAHHFWVHSQPRRRRRQLRRHCFPPFRQEKEERTKSSSLLLLLLEHQSRQVVLVSVCLCVYVFRLREKKRMKAKVREKETEIEATRLLQESSRLRDKSSEREST